MNLAACSDASWQCHGLQSFVKSRGLCKLHQYRVIELYLICFSDPVSSDISAMLSGWSIPQPTALLVGCHGMVWAVDGAFMGSKPS